MREELEDLIKKARKCPHCGGRYPLFHFQRENGLHKLQCWNCGMFVDEKEAAE